MLARAAFVLAVASTIGVPSSNPAVAKKSSVQKPKAKKRRRPPKPPPVSARVKEQAADAVSSFLAPDLSIENAGALVPFFELLFREQRGEFEGPLRILHYGDSHTAADEWTGAMRALLQARFGDGGGGYSLAGHPFTGYRRDDVRGGASRGWRTQGLLKKDGDGLYGLGGVSIVARAPRERIYLDAECRTLEVFYLRQPAGGSFRLYDNDAAVDTIATRGELGPGYYRHETSPGWHRFELQTLDRAPVRLFGWVTENDKGITYETLGINGAQASIVFQWDESMLASNIARRNPALIVLAYGTNEAGIRDWTAESYARMFSALIERFRSAAPTASILVIGPPDRFLRVRSKWTPMDRVDMIVAAQREAALANHCAFWDLRERMGGKGSMRQWVLAGLAQYDHVHFTAPGYRMLADAAVKELLVQYEAFTKAREQLADTNGQTSQNH